MKSVLVVIKQNRFAQEFGSGSRSGESCLLGGLISCAYIQVYIYIHTLRVLGFWSKCSGVFVYFIRYDYALGTAKMGPSTDPMAVVDPTLRVYGIQGLRVIDASIMPQITNGNINAPTVMIGEKGADMIFNYWTGVDTKKKKKRNAFTNVTVS